MEKWNILVKPFWKVFWVLTAIIGFIMIYKAFVNPIGEFSMGALVMGCIFIIAAIINFIKLK